MNAGALLIKACQDDDQHERYSLIYPILFNYRHALELAMKWIIARYGHYSSVKIGNIQHHNLWQLWKVCRKIIGSDDNGDNEAVSAVEQVIKDFHDLDKQAFAFRYSRDKNGALIALPERMIDLENIRDVMEAVDNFFTGADGQLDAYAGAADW